MALSTTAEKIHDALAAARDPVAAMSRTVTYGGHPAYLSQMMAMDWSICRSEMESLLEEITQGFGINERYSGVAGKHIAFQASLLHDAAQSGSAAYFALLLDHGASLDTKYEQTRKEPSGLCVHTVSTLAEVAAERARVQRGGMGVEIGGIIIAAKARAATTKLIDDILRPPLAPAIRA